MIGDYIILKRKELGKKRQDLVKELGVSYTLVCLIETNKRKVTKRLIPKLAKALNVSEEEIEYHNITKIDRANDFVKEQKIVKAEIQNINKEIVKIETNKIILEKKKEYLSEKLIALSKAEDKAKGGVLDW